MHPQRCRRRRYAVRHRGRSPALRHGLRVRQRRAGRAIPTTVQQRIADALAEVGIATRGRSRPSRTATCMPTTPARTATFPGIPIYVQAAEWEIAHTTEHTILEWIDFPGCALRADRRATTTRLDGIRIVATPGHTPGHQSLAVDTHDGLSSSPARPSTRSASGPASRTPARGSIGAPDREAYDRSIERLQALDPEVVRFGHDRRSWTRAQGQVVRPPPAILPGPC